MAMDEHLPHEIKLCEMEFNSDHMRRIDQELRLIDVILSEFQTKVQSDLEDLADDIDTNEWAQLTQASDASLAHIIFKNMSAAQKEVLISLLSE